MFLSMCEEAMKRYKYPNLWKILHLTTALIKIFIGVFPFQNPCVFGSFNDYLIAVDIFSHDLYYW